MANSNVFIACGVDSEIYTSFAFSMGPECTLMLRHGTVDVHDTAEGDIHFPQRLGTTGKGDWHALYSH